MSISSELFIYQDCMNAASVYGNAGDVSCFPSQSSLSFYERATPAKVARATLGIIAIGLPIGGLISGNPAVFVGSVAGSILSFYAASKILDYDDPLELQRMRTEAPHLSWAQLTNKHSLRHLNLVLSQEEIRAKFQDHYQLRRFSEIISDYSLPIIEKYQLANFSEDSFLRTCFLKEMKQFPLSVLRNWYSQSWGLGSFPYRNILSSREMNALLSIQKDLINADSNRVQAIQVLDYQSPFRMDRWIQNLDSRELDIPRQVRIVGDQVDSAVRDAYISEILGADTDFEMQLIKKERDRVALEARKEAESLERERLILEIFLERWDPLKRALAKDLQTLFDMGVVAIEQEHSLKEALCLKLVSEII